MVAAAAGMVNIVVGARRSVQEAGVAGPSVEDLALRGWVCHDVDGCGLGVEAVSGAVVYDQRIGCRAGVVDVNLDFAESDKLGISPTFVDPNSKKSRLGTTKTDLRIGIGDGCPTRRLRECLTGGYQCPAEGGRRTATSR